jgi:hypothetical protein
MIGATVIVGAVPNITGTATEAGLKSNFATGMSSMGKALPVYGKVVGTKMVVKSVRGLKKSSKKILKGGYSL